MTLEEQQPLFRPAEANPEWDHVDCAGILAANTSMRGVEVKPVRDEETRDPAERLCLRGSRHRISSRCLKPPCLNEPGPVSLIATKNLTRASRHLQLYRLAWL